ncbi:polymorphic toxin-type HINT domain-containing protein [Sphaerimonospora mesophila]|uniref:polymorphic toxin-type HINT domain-containing protein n=1 Tax=Sphaerimonospora mesophila TaxID=37483 RepID=UPI00128EFE08
MPKDCSQSWGDWTDWRGYPTVRVITGSGSDPAGYTVTSATFYRGLYDDVFNDGTPKHVQVTDFDGNSYNDLRVLSGRTLQEQTWQATGWSAPTPKCSFQPWSATASYPADWPVSHNGHNWMSTASSTGKAPAPGSQYWSDLGACPVYSSGLSGYTEESSTRYEYVRVTTGDGPGIADPRQINVSRQVSREKVTSGWRYTETKTEYNADGLPVKVNDYGERGDGADNTCTATTYARNTANGAWMISYPASEETRAGDDCSSGTLLDRTVTLYDGATSPSTNAPTKGNVTEIRAHSTASDYSAAKSTFDDYGRPLTVTDPLGKTTTTTYSPAVGWPSGGVTVTNPLGHTTTMWSSPYNGLPVGMRDANNNDINIDYDVLGRTLQLWTPVAPKTGGTPAAKVAYTIPADANGTVNGPAKTAVSRLQSGSGSSAMWVSTHTYLDGLGRARETQTPSPAGGRIVQVTTYDARGLTAATSAPVHNTAAPGSGLLNPALTSLPQWSRPVYDALGRTVAAVDMSAANELRRTTTTYLGADKYEVTPPTGGKTVYYADAADQVTKIEEWLTGAGGQQAAAMAGPEAPAPKTAAGTDALSQDAGEAAQSGWSDRQNATIDLPEQTTSHYITTFTYDRKGQLIKQTDANGNVRTFTYDLLGRRIAAHDPDAGDSEQAYDPAGRMLWSTNGKGQKVSHAYDDLGRKTAMWSGEPGSGTKLAEWTYDTVAKGQLTSATRYSGGNAYTDAVTGYDSMGRPTGSTLTVPSSEGLLAGTYTFATTYNTAGATATYTMPAAGGLPAETVTSTYTDLNLPQAMTSNVGGGFTYVHATTYSPTARLTERAYGAGGKIKRTLAWDETTGWLTGVTTTTKANTLNPVTVQDDRYTYDISGEITRILDAATAAGGSPGQSECFTYDGLHRLSQAWTTTTPECGTGTGSADNQGIDPYAQSYAYDAVGNITSITDGEQTATYTYPQPGANATRPNAVSTITRPDRTDTYTYDNAGQLVSRTVDGKNGTLAWNELGQLEKATIDGQDTTMVYDADGERLIRRDPGGKTTLYLGSMEIEVDGDTITGKRYYTTPDGATVAMRIGGDGVTWLASGLHGSVQLAVNDATGTVSRERYLPFGQRRGADNLPFTDLGFLGKIEDDSTGLTYLSARYYDPATAKFITTDPLLDLRKPQWANPYGYAGNNPIGLSDPSGLAIPAESPCKKAPGSIACWEFNRDWMWDQKRGWIKRSKPYFKMFMGPTTITGYDNDTGYNLAYSQAMADFKKNVNPWGPPDCSPGDMNSPGGDCSPGDLMGLQSFAHLICKYGGYACQDVSPTEFFKMAMQSAASSGMIFGGRGDGGISIVRPKGNLRPKSPCSSFPPDSHILMADGTRKPIEKVEVGDRVLATDPVTGQTGPHPVVALITSEGDKNLIQITIDTDGPRGDQTGTVIATDSHPFWSEDQGHWFNAKDLRPGMRVLTSDGGDGLAVLSTSTYHRSNQRVYNLTVRGLHTYHVAVEDTNVLVHNSNCFSLDQLAAAGRAPDKNNLTRAGFEYQKHMARGQLDRVKGKQLNEAGQNLLEEILRDPSVKYSQVRKGAFAGGFRYVAVIRGEKIGAVFDANGKFAYFGMYN